MDVDVIQGVPRIVRVRGVIDLSNTRQFAVPLEDADLQSPQGFIVDMSGVTYIDSAGIQAILAAYQRLQSSGGRIALVVIRPNVRYILSVTGVDRLPGVSMCESLDAAEKAILSGTEDSS